MSRAGRSVLGTAIGLLGLGCSSLLGDGYFLDAKEPEGSPDGATGLDAADGGPLLDGADASDDAPPPCTVGSQQCQGTGTVLTCQANGEWSARACGVAEVCNGGACATPASCTGWPLASSCGPDGGESCCASPLVSGGSFLRDYDGVTFRDAGGEAKMSDFRLDKFEVTVGRYRQFITAAMTNPTKVWTPTRATGKHAHLNGGKGLTLLDYTFQSFGSEYGWDAIWATWPAYGFLSHTGETQTKAVQDFGLTIQEAVGNGNQGEGDCVQAVQTWDPTGTHDLLPQNCVSWYEAYAFCIWDGGFLPSESEWNYAAAGGSDQRQYPWSAPLGQGAGGTIDLAHAHYCAVDAGANCSFDVLPVGSLPAGNGRWGQSDLTGNVDEWTLDLDSSGNPPNCVDCMVSDPMNTAPMDSPSRTLRGGSFWDPAASMYVALHNSNVAFDHWSAFGLRCARSP